MAVEQWTKREDWEQLALSYWRSALPLMHERPGLWKLSYHPGNYSLRGAEMEGWSRQLWAIVPLLAGGGSVPDFDVVLEGIKAGVDPDHPNYWGVFSDRDQRMVECAVLGAALRMCPESFWQPLSDRTKQQLAEFLNQINQFQTADNNWLFFRVLVNCGLQHVGADFPCAVQEQSLQRIESFVVDEPWYRDGPNGKVDYYNPMGFHYYGLLYSVWQRDRDPARAQVLHRRACLCAEAFIHWFDRDGAAVPYGRSLTYRFAQGSFWSALAWAGKGPFTFGVLKGLLARHLSWWQQWPIHAADGTLTRGYGYPQDAMTEAYNSLGSPYWGFKLFWILALPETHPFWQAEAAPLPEVPAQPQSVRPARLMFSPGKDRAHVVAVSAGHPELSNFVRHAAEKYAKFAWSSQLGFAVPVGRYSWTELAPDNTLLLRRVDDSHWYTRAITSVFEQGEDWLQSIWQPSATARVQTRIELKDGVQIRYHRIWLEEDYELIEGGFAIPAEPLPKTETSPETIRISGQVWYSELECIQGSGELSQADLSPGSHLLFPRACLVVRKGILNAGTHTWTTQVKAGRLERESS